MHNVPVYRSIFRGIKGDLKKKLKASTCTTYPQCVLFMVFRLGGGPFEKNLESIGQTCIAFRYAILNEILSGVSPYTECL